MHDNFSEFLAEMQESNNYLGIDKLKDGHSYKIYARQAYVGVWLEKKSAFVISRYKVGPNSYLFYEYHWDTGRPLGTVKPLELIEKCPFILKDNYCHSEEVKLLDYIEHLEEANPIVEAYNSLKVRKNSSIQFEQRLAGKLTANVKKRNYRID